MVVGEIRGRHHGLGRHFELQPGDHGRLRLRKPGLSIRMGLDMARTFGGPPSAPGITLNDDARCSRRWTAGDIR